MKYARKYRSRSRNPEGVDECEASHRIRWRKPSRLKISQWAEKYAYLPRKGNAEPGKFRLERFPPQRAMLDDPMDERSMETVWMIGRQLGKTMCYVFTIEYYVHQSPSSILVVYPKIDDAKSFLRDKFTATYKVTPCMDGLIKEPRRHDSDNTMLQKGFPGGELSGAGANSPSTLRQRSKRIILLDEVDAYVDNEEGDPVEQADGRAETFTSAVKMKASTPTIKDMSRIEALYEQSDKQMWFIPCPKCGEFQTLKWSQVKFTFERDGKQIRDLENTVYVCESCNYWLSDRQRIAAINAGEWRATAAFNGIRGRHLSGLYRTIGKKRAYKTYLHEFADQFLKAKQKGESSLMVWTNTFLAETWIATGAKRKEVEPLLERIEVYPAEVPAGALVLVGAVDLQATRLECHVAGFGLHEESWAIDRHIIYGEPLLQTPWKELAQFMTRQYQHENGHLMKVAIWFIDSGGQIRAKPFTRPVYDFVLRRQGYEGRGSGGVYASKGMSTPGAQIWREAVQKNGIILQQLGTGEAKGLFYSRLDIDTPGPGYVHFPKSDKFDHEYFLQLTAEESIPEKVRGYAQERWYKRRERNEALDLQAMHIASVEKLNPHWPTLVARYAKRGEQEQKPEQKPTPQKPQRRLVRRVPFRPMRMRF